MQAAIGSPITPQFARKCLSKATGLPPCSALLRVALATSLNGCWGPATFGFPAGIALLGCLRMDAFSWGSGGGLPAPDGLNLLDSHLNCDLDDKTLQVWGMGTQAAKGADDHGGQHHDQPWGCIPRCCTATLPSTGR